MEEEMIYSCTLGLFLSTDRTSTEVRGQVNKGILILHTLGFTSSKIISSHNFRYFKLF